MTPDSDLLRPSLSPGREMPQAIYSVRAVFLTSFFGGPVGSVLFTLINAHRLHRLSRDWPLGLSALVVVCLLRWSAAHHALDELEVVFGKRVESSLLEIGGLVFFGAGWLLHAPYHRSQTFLDLAAPNGLAAGLLCVLAAAAVEAGLLFLLPA